MGKGSMRGDRLLYLLAIPCRVMSILDTNAGVQNYPALLLRDSAGMSLGLFVLAYEYTNNAGVQNSPASLSVSPDSMKD
jgi:hypothetical protein